MPTTQSPTSYLQNMDARRYTLFTISSTGRGYYVDNGELLTIEEFHLRYPLAEKVRFIPKTKIKGGDIDHTHVH